jgi:hypothetical protein
MLLHGQITAQFIWQLDLALRNPATISELNHLATRPADWVPAKTLTSDDVFRRQGLGNLTEKQVDQTQAEVQEQVIATTQALHHVPVDANFTRTLGETKQSTDQASLKAGFPSIWEPGMSLQTKFHETDEPGGYTLHLGVVPHDDMLSGYPTDNT